MLSQQHVRDQHDTKTHKQGVGGAPFGAVGMGLGDHFIADDIKHTAARKSQGKGQHRRGQADGELAQKCTDDLH